MFFNVLDYPIPDSFNKKEINKAPPENWVKYCSENTPIYLVKENCIGYVQMIYDYINEKLCFRRSGHPECWYVDSNGRGINGCLLMLPIKGELPDKQQQLQSAEYIELKNIIRSLERQIKKLNNTVYLKHQRDDLVWEQIQNEIGEW